MKKLNARLVNRGYTSRDHNRHYNEFQLTRKRVEDGRVLSERRNSKFLFTPKSKAKKKEENQFVGVSVD